MQSRLKMHERLQITDSPRNKVVTVRLTEEQHRRIATEMRRNGHQFQWLLESYLEAYAAGGAIAPAASNSTAEPPADLLISMAKIKRHSPAAAAAICDLIAALSRGDAYGSEPDTPSAAHAEGIASLYDQNSAVGAAGGVVQSTGARGAGDAKNYPANPAEKLKKTRAR